MANTEKAPEKAKAKEKKKSFWQGVKEEWKKIIWPTKADVAKQTVLVVAISVLTGVIIAAVDSGATMLVNWLLTIGG